jgi:predicted aminopeptidase
MHRRFLLNVVRALALSLVCLALASCALPFYWQAIGGQLELLRKRTPIETLLDDPATDPTLRTKLSGIAAIRRFAVNDLKLPDNDSYTSYADLGRPYVVWNVVATQEFSVSPERWCFPFAGCVAYRGFFERDSAERFQAKLAKDGYDTYLGGSTAYSTLGYFADPVLNTMIGGGEEQIAGLVFHELAHQKLYVKDDSEFSEAFATAIEEYGTQRWLEQHRQLDALERYHRRVRRRADFAALVLAQQARLTIAFAGSDPPEVKRDAKEQIFATMRNEYSALKTAWGGTGDYDAWFAQPLNNAVLASVATYRRWLPGMRWRLDQVGLDAFYAEAETLAGLAPQQREARLETWLRESSAPRALAQTR